MLNEEIDNIILNDWKINKGRLTYFYWERNHNKIYNDVLN